MPPPTTDVVVNPIDGTAMTVADTSDETLAKLAFLLKQREKQFKQWRDLAEAELVRRMREKDQQITLAGGFELRIESSGWTRIWDGDELETVLRDLVDRGAIQPGLWTGLITHPPKVDGNAAVRLLGFLEGSALNAVKACFRWREGKPRLAITESVELPEPCES